MGNPGSQQRRQTDPHLADRHLADPHLAAEPVGELPEIDRHLRKATQELARLDPKLPTEFTFTWQGTAFSARVERHAKGLRLILRGDLGAVPYCAEDRSNRDKLFALVRGPRAGASCRFHLCRRQRLRFISETEAATPLSGKAMVIRAIQVLLGAKPCFDLAFESCVRKDGGASAS